MYCEALDRCLSTNTDEAAVLKRLCSTEQERSERQARAISYGCPPQFELCGDECVYVDGHVFGRFVDPCAVRTANVEHGYRRVVREIITAMRNTGSISFAGTSTDGSDGSEPSSSVVEQPPVQSGGRPSGGRPPMVEG